MLNNADNGKYNGSYYVIIGYIYIYIYVIPVNILGVILTLAFGPKP